MRENVRENVGENEKNERMVDAQSTSEREVNEVSQRKSLTEKRENVRRGRPIENAGKRGTR